MQSYTIHTTVIIIFDKKQEPTTTMMIGIIGNCLKEDLHYNHQPSVFLAFRPSVVICRCFLYSIVYALLSSSHPARFKNLKSNSSKSHLILYILLLDDDDNAGRWKKYIWLWYGDEP